MSPISPDLVESGPGSRLAVTVGDLVQRVSSLERTGGPSPGGGAGGVIATGEVTGALPGALTISPAGRPQVAGIGVGTPASPTDAVTIRSANATATSAVTVDVQGANTASAGLVVTSIASHVETGTTAARPRMLSLKPRGTERFSVDTRGMIRVNTKAIGSVADTGGVDEFNYPLWVLGNYNATDGQNSKVLYHGLGSYLGIGQGGAAAIGTTHTLEGINVIGGAGYGGSGIQNEYGGLRMHMAFDPNFGGSWTPGSATITGGDLSATATTVNVTSTTGFASSGQILIDSEVIPYTGITATSFTGCTRNAGVIHLNGAVVKYPGNTRFASFPSTTPGRAWLLDLTLQGPNGATANQADLLTGITMLVQQKIAAQPTSGPSFAYGAISTQSGLGNLDTTYPVDYGYVVSGTSGAGATAGFKVGVKVGGGSSGWMSGAARSIIEEGVVVEDFRAAGIKVGGRQAGGTQGHSISVGYDGTWANSTAEFDGINFGGTVHAVLYSHSANGISTGLGDRFRIQGSLNFNMADGTGYVQMQEQTTVVGAAGAGTDALRMYAEDDGAGVTILRYVRPDGTRVTLGEGVVSTNSYQMAGLGIGAPAAGYPLDVYGTGNDQLRVTSTSLHAGIVIDTSAGVGSTKDSVLKFRAGGVNKWQIRRVTTTNRLQFYNDTVPAEGLNQTTGEIRADGGWVINNRVQLSADGNATYKSKALETVGSLDATYLETDGKSALRMVTAVGFIGGSNSNRGGSGVGADLITKDNAAGAGDPGPTVWKAHSTTAGLNQRGTYTGYSHNGGINEVDPVVVTADLTTDRLSTVAQAVTSITSNTITSTAAHGLTVGIPVVFSGSVAPTGITFGTTYYVLTTPSKTTFTIAATVGGATITCSGGTTVSFSVVLMSDTQEFILGGTAPGGLTSGTRYFARDISGASFKVAATSGGAAIDLVTSAGSPTVVPMVYGEYFPYVCNVTASRKGALVGGIETGMHVTEGVIARVHGGAFIIDETNPWSAYNDTTAFGAGSTWLRTGARGIESVSNGTRRAGTAIWVGGSHAALYTSAGVSGTDTRDWERALVVNVGRGLGVAGTEHFIMDGRGNMGAGSTSGSGAPVNTTNPMPDLQGGSRSGVGPTLNGWHLANDGTLDLYKFGESGAGIRCYVGAETEPRFRFNFGATTSLVSTVPALEWGSGTVVDVNLYRSSSNTLSTDDAFTAARVSLEAPSDGGITLREQSSVTDPATDRVTVYAADDGGVSVLRMRSSAADGSRVYTFSPTLGNAAPITGTFPVTNTTTMSTDTVAVQFTLYYSSITIPGPASLTGVQYMRGSVAAGNVRASLYDASWTKVAESASTAVAGADTTWSTLAFTSTARVRAAGTYYIGLQFDDTTARLRTYGGTIFTTTGPLAFVVGSQTNASIAAPATITTTSTTYTAGTGPVCRVY